MNNLLHIPEPLQNACSPAAAITAAALTPVALADAPVCIRLFVDVFTNPPWNHEWVTEERAERYIKNLLSASGALSFLYCENGQPVGLCIGSLNDYFFAPQYKIEEFIVDTKRQQKGIGSAMLAAVEAEMARRGVGYIFLQTSKTIPAYDFYSKRGYTVIEDNVFFIKEIT
jgi:aminoglycoside 6'-N-acetyltransferase I